MYNQNQLLLSDIQKISFAKVSKTTVVTEVPKWLCKYLGVEHSKVVGCEFNEFKELFDDEISEFLERTIFFKKSVRGFRASLIDVSGRKHNLLLDAKICEDTSSNLVGNIFIREIPKQNDKFAQFSAGTFAGLVGISSGMRKVFNKIKMYGKSEAPVLITGETGSGKEGVALAIHNESNRARAPFITMNCSAITDTLFESELFGHEKGAFTGAIKKHIGRFERANNGTLFLDEIGDLPLLSQAKLLRVLETSEIEKVGSEANFKVDVRVVAATNKNLELESMSNNFRLDLFYRINALQIHVPPLRERIEDIEPLIAHFVEKLNMKYNRQVRGLTADAVLLLKKYAWPGNVRELRNLLERLFAENQDNVIGLESLREWYSERVMLAKQSVKNKVQSMNPIALGMPSSDSIVNSRKLKKHEQSNFVIDDAEYKIIEKNTDFSITDLKAAYKKAAGNITKASEMLGIHKSTFYRALKNKNITRKDLDE